jgi:hypothetical protein
MFASVLGMALSIEFGIARTYALGVGFYAVCALMMVISRQANLIGVSAGPVREQGLPELDEAAVTTAPAAPSPQSTQIESAANSKTAKSTVPARADEVIE